MPDTEMLEQDIEGQEQEVEQPEITHGGKDDEPQSEIVGRKERLDAAIDEAAGSAEEEQVLEELAAKPGELTIDDLRKLPGSEELTDEQLTAQWNAAVARAGGQASGQDGQEVGEQTFKLPFPIYDGQGNKIEALEKISLRDLFDGKLQIGYSAMDKEQRKTFAEVVRNAQLGHWNEHKYQTTLGERNQSAQRASELEAQVKQFTQERQVWDAALTALAMGNAEPMKQLAAAFQKALTQAPAGSAPGMVPQSEVARQAEEQARGFQAVQSYIIPKGIDIAQRYGAKAEEVLGAIQWYIEREPAQFFTKEKLDAILQYEVPQLFESYGYKASQAANGGGAPAASGNTSNSEIEALKQTVAALQSQIAGAKNERTEATSEKVRKAPPSGGGSTPGAGDAMPSFKSRSQFKAWSQGDPDWQKA